MLIFILPPSWEELRSRLERRGEDSPEVIELRLKNAAAEMAQAREFDFVIINELFERALFDLKAIVHAQRLKFSAQRRARADTFQALHICLDSPPENFMARITVEDCLVQIPNRFQLVLAATYRARMLSQGHAAQDRKQEQAGRDRPARNRRRQDRAGNAQESPRLIGLTPHLKKHRMRCFFFGRVTQMSGPRYI